MGQLPDAEGLIVACDSETSGLFVDDGSRVAVLSYAYREPTKRDGRWIQKPDAPIVYNAVAFDQGIVDLPLGDKPLSDKILRRVNKTKPIEAWIDGELVEGIIPAEWFYRRAPNLNPKGYDVLVAWLDCQRVTYHNAKFDLQQIRAGLRGRGDAATDGGSYDLEESFFWDTQLAQSILEPHQPTGLKPTAERLNLGEAVGIAAGHEADEQRALAPWRGPMSGKDADPRYDLIPWEIIKPYAAHDSLFTLLLGERQRRLLAEDYSIWQPQIDRQFDLMVALYRMENRGIGFDAAGCLVERDKLEIKRTQLAAELPFDPTPDKARRFFFNSPEDTAAPGCGVIPRSDKMTDGGKPQVDEEVIGALTKHGNPRVAQTAAGYQRHEAVKSAIAKWYGAWPGYTGSDGRLRTSYRQARVVSGRLSAERVQLQAIPREHQLAELGPEIRNIREFFVPDSGLMNWELDLANAEPRIATMVARCKAMYQAVVNDRQDMHGATTMLMFAQAIEPDPSGAIFGPSHKDWDEYRQIGKRCSLGQIYAAGPGAIRDQIRKFTGIEYELSQVKAWVDLYRRTFPEYTAATEWWANYVDQFGFIRTVTNRIRAYAPYEPYHSGFNQVIQGSVADAISAAMVDVEVKVPGAMLLQVHDSLVLQLPRTKAGIEQLALVALIMRVTFERMFALRWRAGEPRRFMPFPVDVHLFGRVPDGMDAKRAQAAAERAIEARYSAYLDSSAGRIARAAQTPALEAVAS